MVDKKLERIGETTVHLQSGASESAVGVVEVRYVRRERLGEFDCDITVFSTSL